MQRPARHPSRFPSSARKAKELPINEDISNFASAVWDWLLIFLPRLAGAIAIVVIGYLLAGYAGRGVVRLIDRTGRLDPTLKPVIRSVVRYAIIIIVIVAALGQLGVQTASILAALGAAGIAIGLALQGTLSNIAAGLMLLWLRPFRAGDYIETTDVAGTVEEINLFHSRIRTWDGIYKFVPNSQLWSTTITNYTRNPTRLILIEFGIAYENDIARGRAVLADFARSHQQVLDDPPVQVVPLTLGDSAVVLQLRAWSSTPEFWATRWDLTEGGKKALEEAGLTIPFPQHVIHFADPTAPPPAGMPQNVRQAIPAPPPPAPVPHSEASATSDPSKQESPGED